LGGTFTAGKLDNRADVIDDLTDKIEAFGCYYLVNRMRQFKRLTSARLRKACQFLPGASREVATIFVDALERNMLTPKAQIRAVTDPPPSGPGSISARCRAAIASVEAMETSKSVTDDLRRRLGL
jgi:hypothetical protein